MQWPIKRFSLFFDQINAQGINALERSYTLVCSIIPGVYKMAHKLISVLESGISYRKLEDSKLSILCTCAVQCTVVKHYKDAQFLCSAVQEKITKMLTAQFCFGN